MLVKDNKYYIEVFVIRNVYKFLEVVKGYIIFVII